MRATPQIRFREELVEGTEPLHRTAYVDDDCVLSAFGNEQEDRWVIGWRPAIWVDWKRTLASATNSFLYAGMRELSSYVLRDDDFTRLAIYEPATPSDVVSGLRRSLQEDGRPDMMVLGTEKVQVELIFPCDPDIPVASGGAPNVFGSRGPKSLSALTLLTPVRMAHYFSPFVASTLYHAKVKRQSSRIVAERLLGGLLGNGWEGEKTFEEEMEHGHQDEGEWWKSVTGGQTKRYERKQ